MSNKQDEPAPTGDGSSGNIFVYENGDYYHIARDASSPGRGAYTGLLENICFMIKDAYGANEQFCLVVPQGPVPEPYQEYANLIQFENHDGTDSVANDQIIARREAASETLEQFLYHLRLTLACLPNAEGVLIEKVEQGKFSLAFKDARPLVYALSVMATQKGFETGIYPLTRHGKTPAQIAASRKEGFNRASIIGDVKPFLRSYAENDAELPAVPYSFREIADVFNTGRAPLPVPAFQMSPLTESIPQRH